jgi:hypothetical protein
VQPSSSKYHVLIRPPDQSMPRIANNDGDGFSCKVRVAVKEGCEPYMAKICGVYPGSFSGRLHTNGCGRASGSLNARHYSQPTPTCSISRFRKSMSKHPNAIPQSGNKVSWQPFSLGRKVTGSGDTLVLSLSKSRQHSPPLPIAAKREARSPFRV